MFYSLVLLSRLYSIYSVYYCVFIYLMFLLLVKHIHIFIYLVIQRIHVLCNWHIIHETLQAELQYKTKLNILLHLKYYSRYFAI